MKDLYGFKQRDVLTLSEKISKRGNRTLADIFEEFSRETGKAKGTVRNMYYAIAKTSKENGEFSKKYLSGKQIDVLKAESFSDGEIQKLLNAINNGKKEGKSVRKTILELSNGDARLALRYQNKYRTLKSSEKLKTILKTEKLQKEAVPEFYYVKLKKEINGLINRISEKVIEENKKLKLRIKELSKENEELLKKLSLYEKNTDMESFFRTLKRGRLVN